MIQSHAHAREYGTHACMKAHISEHVYDEKPYMSKMSYEVAVSLGEAILRMNSQFEYVSNRLRSRR